MRHKTYAVNCCSMTITKMNIFSHLKTYSNMQLENILKISIKRLCFKLNFIRSFWLIKIVIKDDTAVDKNWQTKPYRECLSLLACGYSSKLMFITSIYACMHIQQKKEHSIILHYTQTHNQKSMSESILKWSHIDEIKGRLRFGRRLMFSTNNNKKFSDFINPFHHTANINKILLLSEAVIQYCLAV